LLARAKLADAVWSEQTKSPGSDEKKKGCSSGECSVTTEPAGEKLQVIDRSAAARCSASRLRGQFIGKATCGKRNRV
jgi:hypothetical protein